MSKNRGPDPDEKVLRMLCGMSAGMCQFEGCNERLFYDGVTTKNFINSNVAHIIASSPDGVRGDAVLSHQLSNMIDNLMLMCYTHHKLIDDVKTGEKDYPVSSLMEMKRKHEERINNLCSYFNVPKTELLFFTSPIKGKEVSININLASKSVLPLKQPETPYGQNKSVRSNFAFGSLAYWQDVQNQLLNIFNEIKSLRMVKPQIHFSVFPLAPMPIIAKLGELISDKIPVDVYQKTRVPDTWEWISEELTNTFEMTKEEISTGGCIALIIELTSEISFERINSAITADSIYKISAQYKGVDSIKSIKDLSDFWHKYQETIDDIVNTYGKTCEINLFMAIPVSAAFEIGRRYMPSVYPKIQLYDDIDEGFKPALILGG